MTRARPVHHPARLLVLQVAAALILAAVAFASPAAWARPLTDAEKQSLAQAIDNFNTLMREGRFNTMLDASISPRMLNLLASKAKVAPDVFRTAITAQIVKAMQLVKLDGYSMDPKAAQYRELPSGQPYVLIPTETTMTAEGLGRVKAKTQTLALLDEGKWFLIRISESAQVGILREVYPEFSSVEFPTGTMERADQ
jgi:hypothetical protein